MYFCIGFAYLICVASCVLSYKYEKKKKTRFKTLRIRPWFLGKTGLYSGRSGAANCSVSLSLLRKDFAHKTKRTVTPGQRRGQSSDKFFRSMLSAGIVYSTSHHRRQLTMRSEGRCYVFPTTNGVALTSNNTNADYEEQPVSRTYQYRKVCKTYFRDSTAYTVSSIVTLHL